MPRYVCRRLTHLELPEDDRPRTVDLAAQTAARSLEIQHVVLGPAGTVPIDPQDGQEIRILTLAGRGAATIEGDRIELHRHDLIEIQPGPPCALHAIGRAGWSFLVIKSETPR